MIRLYLLLFGDPAQSKSHNLFDELWGAFPVLLIISLALVWALWVTASVESRDR